MAATAAQHMWVLAVWVGYAETSLTARLATAGCMQP